VSDPENEGSMLLQNVDAYIPTQKMLYPRRPNYSSTLLWKLPHDTQIWGFFGEM